MIKVKNKSPQEWTAKDIEKLPINALKVLRVFIETRKAFLDTNEIQRKLGLKNGDKGKKFGAIMAIFSKYKKEPLVSPVLKIGRGNTRWVLNRKYLPPIKKVLSKVAPYLDE